MSLKEKEEYIELKKYFANREKFTQSEISTPTLTPHSKSSIGTGEKSSIFEKSANERNGGGTRLQ